MSETSSNASESMMMSIDSTSLLIESLDAQISDLTVENHTLKKQIQELKARIRTFQNVAESDIINQMLFYL